MNLNTVYTIIIIVEKMINFLFFICFVFFFNTFKYQWLLNYLRSFFTKFIILFTIIANLILVFKINFNPISKRHNIIINNRIVDILIFVL